MLSKINRKILAGLVVFTISFFISLLMTEGLFRLFSGATKVYYPAAWSLPAIFVESEEGYSLLPSQKARHYSLYKDYIVTYGTNSYGMRGGQEYEKNKPDGTKRIFFLGDSLVFGIGVNDPETAAYQLKSLLNKNGYPPRYEVMNFGVQGYTFDNSYVRLKKFITLDPDLIIFVIAGANDFLDILNHEWVLDGNNDILAVKEKGRHISKDNRFVNGPKSLYSRKPLFLEGLTSFLRRHSVFYAFLGTLRHRNRVRFDETTIQKEDTDRHLNGISKAIDVLDRFFVYTGEKNLKTVFVLEFFRSEAVKQKFLSYLSQKTPYIIDLDEFNKSDDFYLPRDGHWSRHGSAEIADLLYNYIKDKGLL